MSSWIRRPLVRLTQLHPAGIARHTRGSLASVYEWLVPDDKASPVGSAQAFEMVTAGLEPGAQILDCACGIGLLAVGLAEDGAGGRVEAGYCLFSKPPADPPDDAGEAVLVRQTGARTGALVFQSLHGPDGIPQRNGYHNRGDPWQEQRYWTD